MNGVQRVCIYCLKVADKNAFNREHVIEDSMTKGAGIQGNLTLAPETHQSCVCIECNHYFGRELDQSLGRDSFEAMLRSEYGLLKPKKGKPPVIGNSSRLKIKIADGTNISIRHEVNERVATVHAHIRTFNNSTQKYDSYQIDQLSGLLAEQPDMMFEAVNCTDEDFQRINEIVSSAGRNIKLVGDEYKEPDEIHDSQEVQLIVDIDTRYKRAIAKIAFNYLAYNLNSIDNSLVLKDDFHSIRNFVRYGEELGDTFVGAPRDAFTATNGGHLIDVTLTRRGLRRIIIARVCLFNIIPWTVLLTNNYKGIDFALKFKHAWNLDARICTQIFG
jgi:hypothetical protein